MLARATALKDEGNELFRQKKVNKALLSYSRSLSEACSVTGLYRLLGATGHDLSPHAVLVHLGLEKAADKVEISTLVHAASIFQRHGRESWARWAAEHAVVVSPAAVEAMEIRAAARACEWPVSEAKLLSQAITTYTQLDLGAVAAPAASDAAGGAGAATGSMPPSQSPEALRFIATVLANIAACELSLAGGGPERIGRAAFAAFAAVSLDGSFLRSYQRLAQALLDLGEPAAARAVCVRALPRAKPADAAVVAELRTLLGATEGAGDRVLSFRELRVQAARLRDRMRVDADGSGIRDQLPPMKMINSLIVSAVAIGQSRLGGKPAPFVLQSLLPLAFLLLFASLPFLRIVPTWLCWSAALTMMLSAAALWLIVRRVFPYQIDSSVPPFHKEFEAARAAHPAGVPLGWAVEQLELGFEYARSNSRELNTLFEDKPPDAYFRKITTAGMRESECSDAILAWKQHGAADPLQAARSDDGSVRFVPRMPYGYFAGSQKLPVEMHHHFSNAPVISVPMAAGTLHVAIGFVDLATLLSATIGDAPEGKAGPLRWVGYECSVHAVAKTMVIATMLATARIPADFIVQVWYSSAWTEGAWDAFRRAVAQLIAKRSFNGQALPEEALALLQQWFLRCTLIPAPLSSTAGIRANFLMILANFKQSADRISLASHLVSGQLPLSAFPAPGGSAFVRANTTMSWDLEGFAAEAAQNFLQGIPPAELWARRKAGAPDMISAATGYLLERAAALQAAVQSGKVVIEAIHLAAVAPGDVDLLSAIRALEPRSMSWSNVPDYLAPADFHRMARACSLPHTAHHLYSMNWPYDVRDGACAYSHPVAKRRELLAEGLAMHAAGVASLGLADFLHSPPYDNAVNTASAPLEAQQCRRWVAAFIRAAGSTGDPLPTLLGPVVPSVFGQDAFARTNTTTFFSLTYGAAP